MNIKTASALLLTLSCLMAAGIARADTPVYKWVDDKGMVHYSTEPHGDKPQQLAIQNSATPNAGTAVTPAAPPATGPVADASLVQPNAADSVECKGARDRLFRYLHADNLYQVDDKGNKVPLPAANKQKALDEARTYVKQTCGGGA